MDRLIDARLSLACFNGNMDAVLSLIKQGAIDWDWGLRCACGKGHYDIAVLMINKGATWLTTGMILACRYGHNRIVSFLIGIGANGALLLNCGLMDTYINNHPDTFILLLKAGASMNAFYLSFSFIMQLIKRGYSSFGMNELTAVHCRNVLSNQQQLLNPYLIGDLNSIVLHY